MSILQALHKYRSILIKIVLSALVLITIYVIYNLLLSPTRIALINFPAYQVSNIAMSSDSRLIQVEAVSAEKASDLTKYDAILVFGPGLRLTEEQSIQIEKAGKKGRAVYTFVFSSGSINNHNIDSLQSQQLDLYYGNRSKFNFRNMLRYVRQNFDKHKLFITKAEPAVIIPADIFFHLEAEKFYLSAEELTKDLKNRGLYHDNAPRIAFVSGMTSPLEGNRAHIDSLIVRFTKAGFNVYPIASASKRQQLMESVNPDAVIYLPMGRLGNDKSVEWLAERNIPLFCPLSIMLTKEQWLENKQTEGITGGYLTARIVLPEIDGGINPLVISTQDMDKDGNYLFNPDPERLDNIVQTVINQLSLKKMSNREKRVAIVYFKAAGQNSLVAAGMEVAPSLYEFLKYLQKEGYNLTGLPDKFEAFNNMLQQQGAVLGSYAKGAHEEFMKTGNPLWVSKSNYERWCQELLDPDKYSEVVSLYGEAPGKYLSAYHNDEPSLAVACLKFGNIALLPQPLAAVGEDQFKIVHGADVAPPHSYIAPYLWIRKGFEANIIVHFGTHGSLEFTPGRSAGLSHKDWADCLIGSLPHFYYYSIGNVGEAIIAKRRTHATMISHLTPPFMESRTREKYLSLFKLIDEYYNATKESQNKIGKVIKQEVIKLGIHRDLRLDSISNSAYTETEIARIENFAEEIANEKMTGALYTLGKQFSPTDALSTIIAMSADPLAYSLARLDQLSGKITKEQLNSNKFISLKYLQPVKEKLRRLLLSNLKPDATQLIKEFSTISQTDIMKAKAIEMTIKPLQMSMSEMMSEASKSSDNATPQNSSSKMPAGIPKIGKMPDWVKKRIEARKQAKKGGKQERETLPQIPQQDKDFAFAVLEVESVLKNLKRYQTQLKSAPEDELRSFSNAFNGGYISPSPGGDVVLNPNTLPTGRNMYSINAEATPSIRAWDNGKALAEATIKQYLDAHGDYPRKVSYTFWAGEFIETEGATLAQALYMLGIEPLRDGMGRVTDIQLIPSKELGRPRIDIVVQTSGQLRDLAASRLAMITRAISMAASSTEDLFPNYVKEGTIESEKLLVDKGLSPKEARELSTMRVFGGINGGYGTGITSLIEKGDSWNKESEIAETYLNNMGALYGDSKHWGNFVKDLFEVALQRTDIVIQPRQSNLWGALSLDHVYEFMGGLNLTVRNVTGKDPDTYLSDYRNRHKIRLQELKEAVGVESRTTLLNPEYLKEKMKGGATTANDFAETFRNIHGWNIMKPLLIDQELWNDLHEIYVKDKFKLNLQQFFRKENPAALQEISAVMLETARKGYWRASQKQISELIELQTSLIEEFKPSCSGFVCNNKKLQEFIATNAGSECAKKYKAQISAIRDESATDGKEVVLKRDSQKENSEEATSSTGIIVTITLLILFVTIFFFLLKRRKNSK